MPHCQGPHRPAKPSEVCRPISRPDDQNLFAVPASKAPTRPASRRRQRLPFAELISPPVLRIMATITSLPDEILLRCFELLLLDPSTHSRVLWASTLTCRRFHNLAQPLLYSDTHVFLDFPDDHFRHHPLPRHRLQLRALNANSHLRALVRTLSVVCAPVQRASIHHAVPVILSYPHVKHVHLDGSPGDPAADAPGTAAFTELSLQRFCAGTLDTLQRLLTLPAELRSFSIGGMGLGDYDWDAQMQMGLVRQPWTFERLLAALSAHKTTLRRLVIGQMGMQTDLDQLDLNGFSALQDLELALPGKPPAAVACCHWVTPSMRRLTFNCSHNDSQHGIVWFSSAETHRWARDLAEGAAERRRLGLTDLGEITLVRLANYYDGVNDGRELNLLAEVRRDIRNLGFESRWKESWSQNQA